MPPTDTSHILATGSPDEIKAWLYPTPVPDVKDALAAQPADERPRLAEQLAELELERGDDARSTLLAHLVELTPDPDPPEADDGPQDAPETPQVDAQPADDAQDPPAPSDDQTPSDGPDEHDVDEPAPSEVVVDSDCLVNYGGQLLRLTAGEQLQGNLARYCASTGAPVSVPAEPAEEDE